MEKSERASQLLIAIVTQQRSGSKWIGSLIRRRYGAASLGEVFNPDNQTLLSFRSYISKQSVNELIGSVTTLLLDCYFNELRTYLGLFYSFDIMFNQADWVNFSWRLKQTPIYDYLKSRNDVVVLLNRNKADIFLSMKALELTNKAHYTALDNDAGQFNWKPLFRCQEKIRLDLDEYARFSDRLELDRSLIRRNFDDHERFIELCYEDVLAGQVAVFEKMDNAIRDFGSGIGYDFRDGLSPFPGLVKSTIDYNEIFENANEIRLLNKDMKPIS